ncbi:hypothetical protein IV203_029748 [Nitzschia inconspicua]|uniref:Apple domain-containing protein n=1 Tax=Nitzschia inconspicua TaxID=303405 RepID=A0A9K3Q111_9STRA|nr:hypothetical protein IV203_004830 [Nitzschia inconspicua]KAG7367078.1 hypothetical protein IV203_029748 [Nitzschia inconspicua]
MRKGSFTTLFLSIWGYMIIEASSDSNAATGVGSLRSTRQLDETSYDAFYSPQHDGYACRTKKGSHGSNGDEYVKYEYKSLSWCKKKCYVTSDCVAFEYKVEGSYYKCEIWYEMPGNFLKKDGYKCWIKNAEGLVVGDGSSTTKDVELTVDYTKREDKACRTRDGKSGSNGNEYFKYSGTSLEWCTSTCSARQDCKGFEYSTVNNHCEIWTTTPEKYQSKSGLSCYVKRLNS